MADAAPKISRRRRISRVWVVPIVAIALGIWMVIWTWQNQGPEITITFATAEDIEAGKTKIKTRNVDVGVVESVKLGADLESVVLTARVDPNAEDLLRDDTQFWVVRVRVGPAGISGLGTLMSGGYIQLAPGTGETGRRDFEGIEDAPVTPVGTPGLEFKMVSELVESISTGDPILHKGFQVGRVETTEFDIESQKVRHGAFIDAPFDQLVTESTRFWNSSGVSFSATADGISLRTGSLRSMLLGGVSFGLPKGVDAGEAGATAEDGAEFVLYPDWDSVNQRPYLHAVEYVVAFDGSVRGLRPGAPVEYRGLPAGRVERLLLDELITEPGGGEGQGRPIPVLVRLEPGRLHFGDSEEAITQLEKAIEAGVSNGLRATLATGNLLTGSLFVSLDIYADVKPARIGTFADRPTIPTIESGLQGIEQRVTQLLDKLNGLPLDDVAGSANETLRELTATVAELRSLVASQGVRRLPQAVKQTLGELDRTLRSMDDLATTIEERPSSLIFSSDPAPDPQPQAVSP